MLVILSQRIDTDSDYSDKVFETYHYPARYKNQIHEGDTFVYYQGNRCAKEQRFYFGVGTIGKIVTEDGINYYASLVNVKRFFKTVPIYLPDGKYVEQLGYDTVRKSPIPPWQSSIRPISKQAYDYIVSKSGLQFGTFKRLTDDELIEQLKKHIRSFFLENNIGALVDIRDTSNELIKVLNITEKFFINK